MKKIFGHFRDHLLDQLVDQLAEKLIERLADRISDRIISKVFPPVTLTITGEPPSVNAKALLELLNQKQDEQG